MAGLGEHGQIGPLDPLLERCARVDCFHILSDVFTYLSTFLLVLSVAFSYIRVAEKN